MADLARGAYKTYALYLRTIQGEEYKLYWPLSSCCLLVPSINPETTRVPNSPTSQGSEARPDGQPKLISVTRPDQ